MVKRSVSRNLPLVSVYQMLTSFSVTAPVSVLYIESRLGLEAAISLSGVYYLFMVLLEVPSGWASDRFGRVLTLRVGAMGFTAAHILFLVGDRFVVFAGAEAMMAVGYACLSGTDVSFHYDSLESLDRADEYQGRQSSVVSRGYWATAVGAIVGGGLGLIDMRLAYGVALVVALVEVGVTLAMTEPPVDHEAEPVQQLLAQVKTCIRHLADPILGWVFFYGVALVVLEHVVQAGLQPWLTIATGNTVASLGSTPIWSGLVTAVVAVIGSQMARLSDPMARRWGGPAVLVGLGVLSAVIISAMALSFNLIVLALVVFRSAQGAGASVLVGSLAAPRLRPRLRATFLSLNSLAGRLFWGAVLIGVARIAGSRVTVLLTSFSLLSWVLVVALLISLVLAARQSEPNPERGWPAL